MLYHVINTSFLFLLMNNIPLNGYTTLFIYSSVEGHLGCFYLLAIMNNAAIHTNFSVDIRFHLFPGFT